MKIKLLFQVLMNFVILFVLVMFSLRESGLDYHAYMMEFYDPIKNSVSGEFGYKVLINILNPYFDFWFLLLLCNFIFYMTHRKIINRLYEPVQIIVFLVYFINLSAFLILGSPRRLIANSIVVYIIYNEFFSGKKNRNFLWAVIASLFHTSAIVIAPVIFFIRRELSQWLSITTLVKLVFGLTAGFLLFYFSGLLDLILLKIEYYLIYSSHEQEYLSEVPSVLSGFTKRFVSLILVWFAIRKWHNSHFVLKLGFIELFLYTVLGYLSPVLAVVATYFSICYILPFTMQEFRKCNYITKSILVLSVLVYFVPTIIGLIKMFGSVYV